MGLETEATDASHGDGGRLVRGAGPALLHLGSDGFLALIPGGRRTVRVLAPDLRAHALDPEVVRRALCHALEAPLLAEVEALLAAAEIPARRRSRARAAILRERLRAARVGGCWLLRLPPGASFARQLAGARLPQRLLGLGAAHAAEYLLWLLSWWIVGRAALGGRLDRGWLVAWALLLLTIVPFRLVATWWEGRLAIGAGGLLRRRLLDGALRLEPEEIRHQGVGQLLGRVLESEAVESLSLGGGFLALVASIELVMAAVVIGLGAGGWLHALLLAIWVALSVLLAGRYLRHRRRWTGARLELTHDLVERMVGHRTRQVQEDPARWHEAEDRALEPPRERADREELAVRVRVRAEGIRGRLEERAPPIRVQEEAEGVHPVEVGQLQEVPPVEKECLLDPLGEARLAVHGRPGRVEGGDRAATARQAEDRHHSAARERDGDGKRPQPRAVGPDREVAEVARRVQALWVGVGAEEDRATIHEDRAGDPGDERVLGDARGQARDLRAPAARDVHHDHLRRLLAARSRHEVGEDHLPAVGTKVQPSAPPEAESGRGRRIGDEPEGRVPARRAEGAQPAPVGADEEEPLLLGRDPQEGQEREVVRQLEDDAGAVRGDADPLEDPGHGRRLPDAVRAKDLTETERIRERVRGAGLHYRHRRAVPAPDHQLLVSDEEPARHLAALGHHVGDRPDARPAPSAPPTRVAGRGRPDHERRQQDGRDRDASRPTHRRDTAAAAVAVSTGGRTTCPTPSACRASRKARPRRRRRSTLQLPGPATGVEVTVAQRTGGPDLESGRPRPSGARRSQLPAEGVV